MRQKCFVHMEAGILGRKARLSNQRGLDREQFSSVSSSELIQECAKLCLLHYNEFSWEEPDIHLPECTIGQQVSSDLNVFTLWQIQHFASHHVDFIR